MNTGGNDAQGARPVVNEAVMLCEITNEVRDRVIHERMKQMET